jgi:GntR family histidine utilization transcriptional repressor
VRQQGKTSQARLWARLAEEARRRIRDGEWLPGSTIPSEPMLCREWGAGKGTVNRALQTLAAEGLLLRRGPAGTRVVERPRGPATFELPPIREMIERTGKAYAYELVDSGEPETDSYVKEQLEIDGSPRVIRILARHLAGGEPFAWEERWINGGTLKEPLGVDWSKISPDEWLRANAPLTWSKCWLTASLTGPMSARALRCERDLPGLTLERTVWLRQWGLSFAAFLFAPGFRLWSP